MIDKLKKFILDKNYRFRVMAHLGMCKYLSDEAYLKKMFEARQGYPLSLEAPQTFNEKLQWLKLHDRKPIYTNYVDKYEAKKIVANKIGEKYIIPTIAVWNTVDEIDFDRLPNRFVLKCTHDSSGVIICKDKSTLDIEKAKVILSKCMKRNYYWQGREWPYRDVVPRIIAEEYMEDIETRELRDYKVYVFNGQAKFMMLNSSRGVDTRADYFDREGNWLDFIWGYSHAEMRPILPKNFKKMLSFSEILAKDLLHLRVDFYEVNGELYFGELTFYDGSGFDKIEPISWDMKFGEWLTLPNLREMKEHR
ncbi:ATP-grasp fold amidoligase family protein [Streptococcus sp. S784/96/1]|uniref:ATP-grasp fold amidoligase family protein n=1 Tax=Streptococcus sp. S784/96/1 TaxID=2653499 RepID=UPI00138A3120|nr:ATP-grasp fold amidoligase family protein [Streptococcus sp. S784/96/1]